MYGVGAIGNVLTHSSYRQLRWPTTTPRPLPGGLLRLGCDEIILNVRHGNDAGLAAYRRLGFVDHCTFIEGVFHSRVGRH